MAGWSKGLCRKNASFQLGAKGGLPHLEKVRLHRQRHGVGFAAFSALVFKGKA
jgi:hypothetical protein